MTEKKSPVRLTAWACQLTMLLCASLWPAGAASSSIVHGLDSNSRLEVKSTLVRDNGATVLFSTWADRGDEMFARPCSRFYYSVEYSADGKASPNGESICC